MKNLETPKQSAWTMVLNGLRDDHNDASFRPVVEDELPYINGVLTPSELTKIVEQHRLVVNQVIRLAGKYAEAADVHEFINPKGDDE